MAAGARVGQVRGCERIGAVCGRRCGPWRQARPPRAGAGCAGCNRQTGSPARETISFLVLSTRSPSSCTGMQDCELRQLAGRQAASASPPQRPGAATAASYLGVGALRLKLLQALPEDLQVVLRARAAVHQQLLRPVQVGARGCGRATGQQRRHHRRRRGSGEQHGGQRQGHTGRAAAPRRRRNRSPGRAHR